MPDINRKVMMKKKEVDRLRKVVARREIPYLTKQFRVPTLLFLPFDDQDRHLESGIMNVGNTDQSSAKDIGMLIDDCLTRNGK
jgi:hypothetical protein